MTVVVGIKVYDGIVIAADSATTMRLPNGSHQVYNNANKIFQLHRKYPIAAATWGVGSLGGASISTLAKDLRMRLMGSDEHFEDWALNDGYTISEVVGRLVEMFYDELYLPLVENGQLRPDTLGFVVAGYHHHEGVWVSEMWKVLINDTSSKPVPVLEAGANDVGWSAYAIQNAIRRLISGYDQELIGILERLLPDAQFDAVVSELETLLQYPVQAGMPRSDAIRLAKFLIDTTTGYMRFVPGPDIVGGPVEIASISKHEGFKWIQRKHFYPPELNPKEPNHAV